MKKKCKSNYKTFQLIAKNKKKISIIFHHIRIIHKVLQKYVGKNKESDVTKT